MFVDDVAKIKDTHQEVHVCPSMMEISTQTEAKSTSTKKLKTKEKIVQTEPKGRSVSKSMLTSSIETSDKEMATNPALSSMELDRHIKSGTTTAPDVMDIALIRDGPISWSSNCTPKEYPEPTQVTVIKGVPLSVPLEKISSGLRASGIGSTRIYRLHSTKTKKKIKSIMITLSEPNRKAYQLKNISGYFVKMFPFRKPSMSTTTHTNNLTSQYPIYRIPLPPGFDYRRAPPPTGDWDLLNRV